MRRSSTWRVRCAGSAARRALRPRFAGVSARRSEWWRPSASPGRSSLPAPTQVGAEIAAAARTLLDGVRIPPSGVRLLGVRAENLVDAAAFGFQWTVDGSANPHRAELTMDAVRLRFGASGLTPASLLASEATPDA